MPPDSSYSEAQFSAAASSGGAAAAVVPGLLWAFRIDGDGRPQPLSLTAPVPRGGPDLLWLHINLADARALQWLAAEPAVPVDARPLLLSKDTYQQLHVGENCVYGVVADLLRDIDGATEDAGHLRFVMQERVMISGRYGALCGVDATRRALEGGLRINRTAALFETIIDNIASTMEAMAERMQDQLDAIEEEVLSDDQVDLRKGLGQLRRTCVRLHRQLAGLQLVFHRLEQQDLSRLPVAVQIAAPKLAQRLDELDRIIVEMRERARLLQEELQLKMEEQGNNSLRVLSVLTALLMPPTLVTGVFGMNTRALPFADSEAGFWWAALLIAGASCVAYLVLRRIGIIR